VAEAVQGNEAQVVPYLHDVVERGGDGLSTVYRRRDSPRSWRPSMRCYAATTRPREDAVRRAAANALFRRVKQADHEGNLAQVETLGRMARSTQRALCC